jgi:hypothetical protein
MRISKSLHACPNKFLFFILCVRRHKLARLNIGNHEPQLLANHILHGGMCPSKFHYKLIAFHAPATRENMSCRCPRGMSRLRKAVVRFETGDVKATVGISHAVMINAAPRHRPLTNELGLRGRDTAARSAPEGDHKDKEQCNAVASNENSTQFLDISREIPRFWV